MACLPIFRLLAAGKEPVGRKVLDVLWNPQIDGFIENLEFIENVEYNIQS